MNKSRCGSRHSSRPCVCFVAHFAYGAMCGGEHGIGGVQRQLSVMARWFAQRGYQVSMITWDEGQQDGVEIDGVHMYKMCRQDAGVRIVRFFWPYWSSLAAAMRRADADIYYQNGMGYETGQVALWCQWHGRKLIYSVANDIDCLVKFPKRKRLQDRVFFSYGLRHAHMIIAQTKKQRNQLRNNYGLDSLVLPMPCPVDGNDSDMNASRWERRDSNRVLWIGRVCEQKRPDRLLEVANICPDLQFDFVGPAGDSEYTRTVCDRARAIKNVTMHGPVARKDVPGFYKMARVLCCTSDYEGFPNTFLEAWSWGLPIVSTFDPDHLIAERGLGVVAADASELASGIRLLLDSQQLWRNVSQAARQYFEENHTLEAAMPRFETAFLSVAGGTDS